MLNEHEHGEHVGQDARKTIHVFQSKLFVGKAPTRNSTEFPLTREGCANQDQNQNAQECHDTEDTCDIHTNAGGRGDQRDP